MLLKLDDLDIHLKGDLAPIYLISGDDFLLVQESCDAVITEARARGFVDKSLLDPASGFNWQNLGQDAASMSLFSEKRILDLRITGNKFDKAASEAIREYVRKPAEDTILLLRSTRLEPRQRSSAWYKAIDSVGCILLVWPIDTNALPAWLKRRSDLAGIKMSDGAARYLAEKVEGNLLAAAQEIEKLKLIGESKVLTEEDLQRIIGDFAHYNSFELVDAVVDGDRVRVLKILKSLKEEGVTVFPILGVLVAQMRRLKDSKSPTNRRGHILAQFVRRLGSKEAINRVLAQCALVDAQAKGQVLGNPWNSLENLCLRLAGDRKLLSLESQLNFIRVRL